MDLGQSLRWPHWESLLSCGQLLLSIACVCRNEWGELPRPGLKQVSGQ